MIFNKKVSILVITLCGCNFMLGMNNSKPIKNMYNNAAKEINKLGKELAKDQAILHKNRTHTPTAKNDYVNAVCEADEFMLQHMDLCERYNASDMKTIGDLAEQVLQDKPVMPCQKKYKISPLLISCLANEVMEKNNRMAVKESEIKHAWFLNMVSPEDLDKLAGNFNDDVL